MDWRRKKYAFIKKTLETLPCWPLQLTDVKAMLGCTGQTRFLLGCISQLQDGTYSLEDMTGSLQLNLTGCQTSSGLYTGNRASA